MTRSKRSTIAAQIQNGTGNFFNLADTTHRVHGVGELALLRVRFIGASEHVGVDDSRAHRIHADFFLAYSIAADFVRPITACFDAA